MEGRRPPPEASYHFPNNPDMKKFWGTPVVKSFFKSFGVFCLTVGIWGGINMYLSRHQKGPFGTDIKATKESVHRRIAVINEGARIRDKQLPIDLKQRLYHDSSDVDMRFDDGVVFVAPTNDERVSGPI